MEYALLQPLEAQILCRQMPRFWPNHLAHISRKKLKHQENDCFETSVYIRAHLAEVPLTLVD